jgi:hypothetical protein
MKLYFFVQIFEKAQMCCNSVNAAKHSSYEFSEDVYVIISYELT